RECCRTVCVPVCETHHRECCQQVRRPVCETVMKNVCCTEWKDVVEKGCRDVAKWTCEPCTTMRTVVRRIPETVCETYVIRGRFRVSFNHGCRNVWDLCTCSGVQKRKLLPSICVYRDPDCCGPRQVCRYRCVCEQVPCTTYVRKCHIEK